jgi:hypothetical protein
MMYVMKPRKANRRTNMSVLNGFGRDSAFGLPTIVDPEPIRRIPVDGDFQTRVDIAQNIFHSAALAVFFHADLIADLHRPLRETDAETDWHKQRALISHGQHHRRTRRPSVMSQERQFDATTTIRLI